MTRLCPLHNGQRSSAGGAPSANNGEVEDGSEESSHGPDFVMHESSDEEALEYDSDAPDDDEQDDEQEVEGEDASNNKGSTGGAPHTNNDGSEEEPEDSSNDSDYEMYDSSEPPLEYDSDAETDVTEDEWDHDQGRYVINVVGRAPNTAYHVSEAHFNALAPGTVSDNPHRPQDAKCVRPNGCQVAVLTYTRDKLTGHWAKLEKDIPPW